MPVMQRNALEVGQSYRGPMLVIDAVATTFVAASWIARLHNNGCLMLERSA
jgi:N-methylhydantoinase A/oxoprolinase/acetone carboxylase beta subunit